MKIGTNIHQAERFSRKVGIPRALTLNCLCVIMFAENARRYSGQLDRTDTTSYASASTTGRIHRRGARELSSAF